ncbi:MAG: polysaccharide deacetylase family protein [Candidatus Cloacimonetes bacterium]|nr:polysaccharide deacetylase family protein [Candidatus Cloacimonadota bacterium]
MRWLYRLICALLCSLALLSCSLAPVERPATIICITFDDAHYSVFQNALLILQRYGIRATSFVNSGLVGTGYAMDWNQIVSLEKDYYWETGAHGLSHANLAELDMEEARHQIVEDKRQLEARGLTPRCFALPYGVCPSEYYPIIAQHYRYIRGSHDITMQAPVDGKHLGYFSFQDGWTAQEVKARILRGLANQEALIIIGFHSVGDDISYYGNCPPSELEALCGWLQSANLPTMTLSEAMSALKE